MPVLSVPWALVDCDEVSMAVFHELSRAAGPSQQRTQTDRLPHFALMHKAKPYATYYIVWATVWMVISTVSLTRSIRVLGFFMPHVT